MASGAWHVCGFRLRLLRCLTESHDGGSGFVCIEDLRRLRLAKELTEEQVIILVILQTELGKQEQKRTEQERKEQKLETETRNEETETKTKKQNRTETNKQTKHALHVAFGPARACPFCETSNLIVLDHASLSQLSTIFSKAGANCKGKISEEQVPSLSASPPLSIHHSEQTLEADRNVFFLSFFFHSLHPLFPLLS